MTTSSFCYDSVHALYSEYLLKTIMCVSCTGDVQWLLVRDGPVASRSGPGVICDAVVHVELWTLTSRSVRVRVLASMQVHRPDS